MTFLQMSQTVLPLACVQGGRFGGHPGLRETVVKVVKGLCGAWGTILDSHPPLDPSPASKAQVVRGYERLCGAWGTTLDSQPPMGPLSPRDTPPLSETESTFYSVKSLLLRLRGSSQPVCPPWIYPYL
jgi:hypothetical protein